MAMQLPALFAMRWRGFQEAQREAATLSPTDPEAVQAFLIRHFGSEARPHVLAALVDLLPISGANFWELVVGGWEMFDAIPHARYAALFATHAATRPAEIGSAADRAFHDALPDPVTLYRGQSGRAALGLSWTTDKAVAESFAQGHRGIAVPAPTVFTLAARRQEIAFCCAERGESEVVLMAVPAKRRVRKV